MSVATRPSFEVPQEDGVAQRLAVKFGMGSRPDLRRDLYRKLEHLVEDEGERAYEVIASAAADANGKNDPGKYFAFVVLKRLQERGVLPKSEGF